MRRKRAIRTAIDLAIIFLLEYAGLYAMAHWRVMEVLLSPGGHSSRMYVVAATGFLMVRVFLVVAGLGWFLARLFLVLTAAATSPSTASDTGRGSAP